MGLKRFLPFRKVNPANDSEDARDLSGSYCEHTWDIHRIADNFQSSGINIEDIPSSAGLTNDEAAKLIAVHGENSLPKAKEISDFMLFLSQFYSLLWALLGVATILSFIEWVVDIKGEMPSLYVTIILAVMIFLMCCVSFYQERKAQRTVRGFANLLPEVSAVIRNHAEVNIPASQLTRGDIVVIRSGNRVPADCRVLKCTEFKLESSSITGEAEPLEYHPDAALEGVTVFDAKNVAFNGSMCVDGFGYALVIRTGTDTVIGQIAKLTTGQKDKGSLLQIEISRFLKVLAVSAVVTGTLCFVIGGVVHKWHNIASLITNGFLVSAIGLVPCGLAATVTSMLTLIARRMATKNVYLKRLDIVEALGCATVIASDKTGTLTKNVMTVTDLWYCDKKSTGAPAKTESGSGVRAFSYVYERLFTVMSVCNVAEFLDKSSEKKVSFVNQGFTESESDTKVDNSVRRPASGSPSEVAMILFADPLFSVDGLRKEHNMVFEIPFNSKRKWHLQIHNEGPAGEGKSQYRLMMKGAPEILIKKCSSIYTDNGVQQLDTERLATFQCAYDDFGNEGKRVIGFVETVFIDDSDITFSLDSGNFPIDGLTFCGMCAIMDPPRDETARAIDECKTAGIKVFMVTGDHPSTAAAIARQINLLTEEESKSCVIHGERIPKLSEEDWNAILMHRFLVFARTTPEQKLLIVEQCQKRGEKIIMTGDGVNDSPALKKATVGVAMGSGSEVAKQAADVILMDDNFSSIVNAIEQGRLMFDNLKKLLGYTFPHCFPELWPIILYYCFGMPQGLTSLQILSIDLGTELLPGVSMSSEPVESNIMKRPPRRKGVNLVSKSLLFYSYIQVGQFLSVGSFLSYLYIFWKRGIASHDLFWSENTWGKDGFTSNGVSFTWDQQKYILQEACGAWYIGIVVMQCFHLFGARTRKESIFRHGIFSNPMAIVGVIVEVGLLCLFVYTPGLNTFLGMRPPLPEVWGMHIGFGILLFAYNEARKWCIRRWPKNWLVRWFKW